MGEVNVIVGLSGVGKGTVLEEAILLSDKEYEVINYGDKMFETASENGIVDHRDDMKDIDTEMYRDLQMDAAEEILGEAKDNDIIVETHACIKTPYGYIPGLPKWTLENLEPSKIIMIDADSEEIKERCEEEGRERDTSGTSVEKITEYRNTAKQMASAGAVQTGSYFKIIENRNGQAEAAAEELVKTLKG